MSKTQSTTMSRIIRKLAPLRRVFCSREMDQAIGWLKSQLPFKEHTFSDPASIKGWTIPPKWDVIEATIRLNNKVIHDATKSPLGVICLSSPFEGRVQLQELKRHLYTDERNPAWTPFHYLQLYRPWIRDWGFCVSKDFYDSLREGEYNIRIRTEESAGYLKILEYVLPGEITRAPNQIIFIAHLDHPGMANDDLSGCAVLIELFRILAKKTHRLTYRLLIVPEFIGSVYFLEHYLPNNSLEGLFLETVGTCADFLLQHSYYRTTGIETALSMVLSELEVPHRTAGFRSETGNDETIWESYGVPMCSLARFPYSQFHSDQDSMEIISETALEDTLNLLIVAVAKLEQSRFAIKTFNGMIGAAHPDFNLWEPVEKLNATCDGRFSAVPYHLCCQKGPLNSLWLSDQLRIPHSDLISYLEAWEHKGLIKLI